MKRRMLTVALAALLAVLGIAAVLAYVQKANDRAIAGLKVVSTLVANAAIPAGTSASDAVHKGLLVGQKLPVSSVPADAVRSVTPELSGLVTSAAIQPGQLLLRPMLVPAAQVTGAIAIPQGDVAVTVQLCLPADVAGYVQPGSNVAVFDTFGSSSLQETCDITHQVPDIKTVYTRILLTKVEVLSVTPASAGSPGTAGTSTTLTAGGTGSTGTQPVVLVTLAVNQADAEKLILADQTGMPYLALLTPSSVTALDPAARQLFKP